MSIEVYVLSDKKLSEIADWQAAINAEGFDLVLDTSRPFEALHGYLPAHRGEKLAGFECDHWDPTDILNTYDDIEFGRRWSATLAFRFGGRFHELWGAYAAAAAYARATDGVVFDTEEGRVMTPDEAAEVARSSEQFLENE
jgi:hypothetical protein